MAQKQKGKVKIQRKIAHSVSIHKIVHLYINFYFYYSLIASHH